MFNYENLSDVEFEELCKDIMQKKLGSSLYTYTKGRDGGIDICDDFCNPKVIIQVKHYKNYSILKSSLKKEPKKLDQIRETGISDDFEYYICTSCGLTRANVMEIHKIFEGYICSDDYILGRNEIEDFLNSEKGKDVLFKHHKLGLSSYTIAETIYYDATIDSKALFDEIENIKKFFVPTVEFNRILNALSQKRIVILTGNPGVGKTMTSKMLILEMVNRGYRIIYVSDHNIKESKALLSRDSDEKELIFLDDCFGQRYFELKDETGAELNALIRYVRAHSNKILLMNSRVSIYHEAKERYSDFADDVMNKKLSEVCIEMKDLEVVDRAQIFYNHLYFNNVSTLYLNAIKDRYNYRKIVRHPNYSPRIISHVTSKSVIEAYSPQEYVRYIFYVLDNPALIWENEYIERLSNVDRMFMNTLFSLSDGVVPIEVHKRAYMARLRYDRIDSTGNVWEKSKKRLVGSMLKMVSRDGTEELSVADPSVNDYLESYLNNNICEVNTILHAATEYIQFQRLNQDKFIDRIKDGTAISLNFTNDGDRALCILSEVLKKTIILDEYSKLVKSFYRKPMSTYNMDNAKSVISVYIGLLQEQFDEVYKSKHYVNAESIHFLLHEIEFSDFEDFFETVKKYRQEWLFDEFKETINECIYQSLSEYIKSATVEDYNDDNLMEILDEHTMMTLYGSETNIDAAVMDVMDSVEENIYDEIYAYVDSFPVAFKNTQMVEKYIRDYLELDSCSAESLLEDTLRADEYVDYHYEEYREWSMNSRLEDSAIDRIFR